MESTIVALYESYYELNYNFLSLFGFNERTKRFYEKYGELASKKELSEILLNSDIIDNLLKILKYRSIENNEKIPIFTIWNSIITSLSILIELKNSDLRLQNLLEITEERLEKLSDPEKHYILENIPENKSCLEKIKLYKNSQNFISLVNHIEEGHLIIPKISSPENIILQNNLNETIEKMKNEMENFKTQIENLQNNKKQEISINNKEIIGKNKTCDECELETLNQIEVLLEKNKITDLLEIINKRQAEIKLAEKAWNVQEIIENDSENSSENEENSLKIKAEGENAEIYRNETGNIPIRTESENNLIRPKKLIFPYY